MNVLKIIREVSIAMKSLPINSVDYELKSEASATQIQKSIHSGTMISNFVDDTVQSIKNENQNRQ